MAERTLVVAAANLLARGFLAVPTDRHAPDGAPVGALFAVARALGRVLAFKAPARAVAVLGPLPPAAAAQPLLVAQLSALGPLLALHGVVPVAPAPAPGDQPGDAEAHLVAAYAQAALDAGDDVVVLGMDKRFAQLVGDHAWWYDANKDVRYTPELVRKRFHVGPDRVADWLALVGDDDALPGIAGIGAKGAAALLEAHGTAEAALAAALASAVAGRPGAALRAAADALPGELARARLDRGRPLPAPLSALGHAPAAAPARNARYQALGFAELLSTAAAPADAVRVTVCDTPDALSRELAALTARAAAAGAPVSIHALTEDPTPIRGALAGVALAVGDGAAIYVPFAGAGPCVPPAALAPWLADPAVPKAGYDVKSADVALRRVGIQLAGVVGDAGCASHLTQPSNWAPHDLPLIARYALGRAIPEADEVRGLGPSRAGAPGSAPPDAADAPPVRPTHAPEPGAAPPELPARSGPRRPWAQLDTARAGAYAGACADAAAAALRALAPGVEPALLAEYLALSAVLVGMELHGIAVDASELAGARAAFAEIEADLEREIYGLAGRTLNLGSSKQLGDVLFAQLGLPVVSRTKTGWSTATEALERIEHAHPIVPLVIRWRLLRRLRDTWITALIDHIAPDGRVHSWFHPARSFSGRIVNSDPDLGRVPKRTPEMLRIRRAFVAAPGCQLLSIDYSQLGLHVLAHLTGDPALVEPLQRGDDLHVLTAAAVLDRPAAAISADERQLGKVVNFATFAGQGASALALQLGLPAAEARDLIARFDRRYARVRAFQDEQLRLAHERGYVVTLAGRRWPIGGLASLDAEDRGYAERLARRATHEGSVADVARRGLLDADRALRRAGLAAAPVVQILDEVLFEVPASELAEAARVGAAAMRGAFALAAPLRVGLRAGPTWADLAPLPAGATDPLVEK